MLSHVFGSHNNILSLVKTVKLLLVLKRGDSFGDQYLERKFETPTFFFLDNSPPVCR